MKEEKIMINNGKYLRTLVIAADIFITCIAIDLSIIDFSDLDVTGLGQTMLRILVCAFVLLGIICLKNAISVREKGVSQVFNRFMMIVFIVFAIICSISGICLRSAEEKMAVEYYANSKIKTEEDVINYLLKNKNAIQELTKQPTKQEERLEVIKHEIDITPNVLSRYIQVFLFGFSLDRIDMVYYIAYTIMTVISLYFAWFFFSTIQS